jgi:hypothetical protein
VSDLAAAVESAETAGEQGREYMYYSWQRGFAIKAAHLCFRFNLSSFSNAAAQLHLWVGAFGRQC